MRSFFFALLLSFSAVPSVQASGLPDYGGVGIARWNISPTTPNLDYFIDSSATAQTSLIQSVFADWAAIPTVYVTFMQVMSADQAEITFKVSTLSEGGAGGVAKPQTDSNGNLTHCDIEISSEHPITKNTIQHEAGHCLGLQHSVVSGAVMSYRNPGAKPTVDDQYALTLLYPRDSSSGYPMGCATVSSAKGGGSGNGIFFLLLAAVMAIGFRMVARKTRKPMLVFSR